MPDEPILHGLVGDYFAAFRKHDLCAMRDVAFAVVSQQQIALSHPENSAINTFCYSSLRDGMVNLLFFADESGGNRWCLMQRVEFMTFVVTETASYMATGAERLEPMRELEAKIRAGALDNAWRRRDSYGGLTVGSQRPFPFFSDQLLQVPVLSEQLPAHLRKVAIDAGCFLRPDLPFAVDIVPIEKGRYYIFPPLIGANRWRRNLPASFFQQASVMEEAIRTAIPPAVPSPRPDFTLWIGVIGEKRSWVSQVEGYCQIIGQLARIFPDLLVYIDGMTAPHGKTIKSKSDENLAEQIAAGCPGNVRIETLVGQDYEYKIARCHGVDAFIANAGSGCIVPLRMCGKPGVLHSNTKLQSFQGDDYGTRVITVAPAHTFDLPDENGKVGFCSYDIHWQQIYADLRKVLSASSGIQIPEIPVPSMGLLAKSHAKAHPEAYQAWQQRRWRLLTPGFTGLGSLELNAQIQVLDRKELRMRSTGGDPIIRFRGASVTTGQRHVLHVEIVSDVASKAKVYYSDTSIETPVFTERRTVSQPVVQGMNSLRFELFHPRLGNDLRLDPLACTGDFRILSARLESLGDDTGSNEFAL